MPDAARLLTGALPGWGGAGPWDAGGDSGRPLAPTGPGAALSCAAVRCDRAREPGRAFAARFTELVVTIFAGVFSRSAAAPLDESVRGQLSRALSRHPGDAVAVLGDRRCLLAKLDIGAYAAPAACAGADGSVSVMAGEPLLAPAGARAERTRAEDLALLHDAWARGEWGAVATASGVFSAAHYSPAAGRLTLVTDKLGVRPLYWWAGEHVVVFATAMRILEQLALVPKVMDVLAVTEMICLGAPLGDRTPYADVTLLRGGEIVQIDERTVARREYWRWDAIARSDRPVDELARDAYEQFNAGVARRLGGDAATVAFLSGGLDSRAVVAALRLRDARVHTFNFARAGSQDQVFGAEFARRSGTIHPELPIPSGRPRWSMMLAEGWRASPHRARWPAERPALAWSGDGGSVGLGHVYMTRAMVDHLRAGERDAAIAALMRGMGGLVPHKLLRAPSAEALTAAVHQAASDELGRLRCEDPGRSLHVFLLLNDQRRHLAEHFETIDLHRTEFQLPFFDSAFLESVLASPVDDCLGHGFYMKWLALFPPIVTSVPWQAYPGHAPCPLPAPEGLVYQWDQAQLRAVRNARKRELLGQAREMLRADSFPHRVLRRSYLRLAVWAYRLGLRDCAYLIETAQAYHRYWTRSGGAYALPVARDTRS